MPSPHRNRLAKLARIGLAWAALCVIGLDYHLAHAQAPGPAFAPAAPAAAPAPPAVPAGAPAGAAAPGGVPGAYFFRLGFPTVNEFAFANHPFFQITGNSAYANGKGTLSTSLNYGAYESDHNADTLVQLLHSLPPFYLEAGKPVDLFLPKAVTLGFDYYAFSQTGTDASGGRSVPPIKMDMWLYQLGVRGYAFDPTQPGINFYLGLGFGFFQGNLTAEPPGSQSNKVIGFNQFPTGSTLFGIDVKGDNFGLRYELNALSAKQVSLKPNPYTGSAPTTIDFSGSLIRLALFYQF